MPIRVRRTVIRVRRTVAVAVALPALTVACTSDSVSSPASTASPAETPVSSAETGVAAQPPDCAQRVLHDMSLPRRVGQLFISGVDSAAPTRPQLHAIRHHHLAGAILTGRSSAGRAATQQVTRRVRAHSTGPAAPWVAVDQEGGYVQVLQGPGFSDIPTALAQGRLARSDLKARWQRWGRQLHAAGVTLNLAPVADTVPARLGSGNPPIGYYDREYAHRPGAVAKHARAVWRGMRAAQVQATAKHFPGLGRVHQNTDTSAHVVDRVTTRRDPYLKPFAALIDNRIPVVMVSSARYAAIDRHRLAVFSSTIMRGMLRDDLGFSGVIMSDDIGAAVAVQDVPAGRRAVRFISAGGTVVLTVSAVTVPPMVRAVLQRARAERRFRHLVEEAALKVLKAKHQVGLLTCRR